MRKYRVVALDVNRKVLFEESFYLRRNARRRAADIEVRGREMARLITEHWLGLEKANVPAAAYTAEIRRP